MAPGHMAPVAPYGAMLSPGFQPKHDNVHENKDLPICTSTKVEDVVPSITPIRKSMAKVEDVVPSITPIRKSMAKVEDVVPSITPLRKSMDNPGQNPGREGR